MAALKWIILVVSIPVTFGHNMPHNSVPAISGLDNGKSELGDHCTEDEECTFDNSKCEDKRCACKDYYFDQDGQCVAGLNAACQIGEECKTPNAECNEKENKCKCQSDYIDIVDKCMPKSKYNETCAYNVQCSETVAHTTCKTGKSGDRSCACEDDYLFKNGKCYLKKLVDEKCTAQTDVCTTEHSDCVNEKCQCIMGYHKKRENCFINELGTKCEKDEDCNEVIHHSSCYKGKCDCNEDYFTRQKQCLAGLNAHCQSNDECHSTNSECREDKCQCKSKYVATSVSECLPVSQHAKECLKDPQCSAELPNSFCKIKKGEKKGLCDCNDKFHFKNNKCHPDRLIDEECKDSDECVTSNTECNVKCKCKTGYKQVEKECVLNQLGDECANDADCTTGNQKCTDKKCACKDNYFIQDGKCVAGLNAHCQSNDECHSTNSECREDKCQCKSKFVATSVSECLPVSQHKQECKHTLQCSAGLAHTFCNTTKGAVIGICDCEEAYLFRKDKCYQKKWVNNTCTEENDVCVTANSHCNDGKCECLLKFPNLIDGVCNSSINVRPPFSAIALVLLALKVMF